MDKPDLIFIGADKPAWTGVFAAFDPLAALKAERAGIKSVLNAVVPKIEYWSEFHALILLTVYRPKPAIADRLGTINNQASIPTLAHVSHHWPVSPNSRSVNS